MDTTCIYELLEQFACRPLDCLSHKKLEKLYEILLNFLLENDEELSDEFHDLLEKAIASIARELERQDKELPNLATHLIYNPSEVELVLSQMTLSELLVAESRGSKLKSPLLRRQFANMVTRCMQNICTDNCMLAC